VLKIVGASVLGPAFVGTTLWSVLRIDEHLEEGCVAGLLAFGCVVGLAALRRYGSRLPGPRQIGPVSIRDLLLREVGQNRPR
jgi:hypothetical protein